MTQGTMITKMLNKSGMSEAGENYVIFLSSNFHDVLSDV